MTRPLMTNQKGRRILQRLGRIKPFIQASLSITQKRCGNPRCKCVDEGPIHQTALLTWKEGRRTRTLYVPIEFREEVAKWVEEGKALRRLIVEMSDAQRDFLMDLRRKRKQGKRRQAR
jgi:hypothetical protein